MKRFILVAAALFSFSCSSNEVAAGAASSAFAHDDRLLTSIAWIGGCREDPAHWDKKTNPSSANVAELKQTLADIASLSVTPRFFFFPGDLVLGFADQPTLTGQLDAWAELYQNDPSNLSWLLDLIPIAGNHEVLVKTTRTDGTAVELANPVADQVWTDWIARNGYDLYGGNGPVVDDANADALQDDQSTMSYSFDEGSVHYVVLNTDTWTTTPDPETGSTQIGWIAFTWLEADLEAAQADPNVRTILVFGHKPIVSPLGKADSEDAINPAFTSRIEKLFDQSSKVKGYFTSHAHLFDARRLPGSRGVWQIVAGNGGTALDPSWTKNPYFGFTVANVYRSGRVGIVPYGRPVPTPYDSFSGVQPAQPMMPELTIFDP
jgi:hypothetical protein